MPLVLHTPMVYGYHATLLRGSHTTLNKWHYLPSSSSPLPFSPTSSLLHPHRSITWQREASPTRLVKNTLSNQKGCVMILVQLFI
jgi:hypothetical protein